MERNIGADNRRIPPDVKPKGSTSRDLERHEEPEEHSDAPDDPDARPIDHD